MPFPAIRKNDTKEEYIKRFMASLSMRLEYPDEGQRYIVAMEHWDKKKKEQKNG